MRGQRGENENRGDIGRWFHYQLWDAHDVIHRNSEEGLQNTDQNKFTSALSSPTKCHDRLSQL